MTIWWVTDSDGTGTQPPLQIGPMAPATGRLSTLSNGVPVPHPYQKSL